MSGGRGGEMPEPPDPADSRRPKRKCAGKDVDYDDDKVVVVGLDDQAILQRQINEMTEAKFNQFLFNMYHRCEVKASGLSGAGIGLFAATKFRRGLGLIKEDDVLSLLATDTLANILLNSCLPTDPKSWTFHVSGDKLVKLTGRTDAAQFAGRLCAPARTYKTACQGIFANDNRDGSVTVTANAKFVIVIVWKSKQSMASWKMWVFVVALRHIAPGEEVIVDYLGGNSRKKCAHGWDHRTISPTT
jgi:hypothetical protein